MLSYLGLDLPWGRWPWTIHSALWGIVPNLCVTLLLSAVTRRIRLGEKAQDIRHLLDVTLRSGPKVRALQVTAWSVVLAWVFLAAGPGLIFGNTAFVSTDGAWLLGMPSLWGWALLFWAAGLGMVWFLSYKMELASPLTIRIPPYAPKPRLRHDQTKAEAARLRTAVITVVAGFGIGLMTVLSFGG
jgi:SSS family solute:Na+ symporter